MKQIFNKKTGEKSVFLMLAVVAIIMVFLVNIVAGALTEKFNLQIDLTKNRLFRLDDATAEYLNKLETPVKIEVLATEERFVNTSTYNAQANEIMRQFAKKSDNISVSYIDYIKDPTFAAKYPDISMKHGDVLVSTGEKYCLVKTEELFNYSANESGQMTITSSKAEQSISSAILNVTSTDVPKVSMLSGHGEHTMPSFASLLNTNNFEVKNLRLATESLSPETNIAVLIAPKNDLSADELQKIDDFLNNNGNYGKTFLYCADAEQAKLPSLEAFLNEWGVKINDGAVFETDENRVYNYHPFYGIADYVNEEFSSLLRTNTVPMLMPISRPLERLFEYRDDYSTDVLLEFGESTGVRPSSAGKDFTADKASVRGPMPALMLCSYKLRDKANATSIQTQSNVIVSSSSSMLDSYALDNSSFSNAEYIVNLLNHLCRRENAISVTPKTIAGSALNIPQKTADNLGSLFVFVLPLIVLALGFAVWLSRRHK